MWLNSGMTHFTVLEGWLSGLDAQQYSLEFSEGEVSHSQNFICVFPMEFLNNFTIFMYKFSVADTGAVVMGVWY